LSLLSSEAGPTAVKCAVILALIVIIALRFSDFRAQKEQHEFQPDQKSVGILATNPVQHCHSTDAEKLKFRAH
jgi:hypothetical protein